MKTFIEEVIEELGTEQQWANTVVIFPNRRAGLFFRQALVEKVKGKTIFAPEIYSLEDFVFQHVPFAPADALTLTGLLYKSYKETFSDPDSFADFFFWGKMILNDFDDLDQHLADAKAVYSIVQQQKQLDMGFDFLTPEQIRILSTFWQKFTDDPTAHKDHFVSVWKKLYSLYETFQKLLKDERIAYKGLAYRTFVEDTPRYVNTETGHYIFAGFNALTRAEEALLKYFITEKQAKVVWDTDSYYVKDEAQEAGRFMRQLSRKSIFQNSFPKELPERISNRKAPVNLIGVPYRAGQAKFVGQELEKLLNENPDIPLHKIAIVLPDEQLLFAVLNALPPAVDKFNVTMGFPVETTPLFSLLLHCLNLQEHINPDKDKIYFRPVLRILQHPVIEQVTENVADNFVKNILKLNKVYLDVNELLELHPLFATIFRSCGKNYTTYLTEMLEQLSSHEEKLNPENITALNFIAKQLYELQEFEAMLNMEHDLRNFSRFLRQLLSSDKIPFEGEPLRGLQIMGVLETRNLDFEHIFVLSLNEDYFPSDSRQKSFIPYNIRKAFDLPVFEQQDAIYAYLFYRLFQRSRQVTLLYNTEGNVVGGQEMSRFLQQLIHEEPFPVNHKLLNTPVQPKPAEKIVVEKDERVMEKISSYLFKEVGLPDRWLYPSTVYSYLFCRMQFYFRYIARIREADGMEDEVDARIFGNILHDTMEKLYKGLMERKGNGEVLAEDIQLLKKQVQGLVEEGFKEQFGSDPREKFDFSGQNIIQREMLVKFINRILDYDKKLSPFNIKALETDNAAGYEIGFPVQSGEKELKVGLKGKIDRLDELNGNVRVIDYKTGGDKIEFRTIEELFERDNKNANKAAFQTLFYSLLYVNKHQADEVVTPGLYSRTNLFLKPYDYRLQMGKSPVVDYRMVQQEYEEMMQELLGELFNPEVPFDQTEEISRCGYCPYNGICRR